MRALWILGILAMALSIAALISSIMVIISPAGEDDEDDESIRLADRGEFTVDLVQQALRR